MSREIKFRAWDTVQEKLLPVERINFREDVISLDEGDNSVTDTSEMFILMQYTGLKDKNGKEIYEGDIVTLPIEPNADLMQAIIEWDFNGWKFKWLKSRVSNIRGKTIEPVFHNIKFFEVIGNIHENKELLEVVSND